MEYLLKVSAIVAIFYVSYKLFLERDTFFEQNRWFLLLGLITSFVIPFFVIPVYIEYTPVSTNFIYRDMVMETAEEPFNILDYLPAIYALGALCFFVRFIIQLTSLGFVVFKNKSEKQGPFTFVTTNKNTSPFSFFNWIVYNPNNFTKTELEQIITHEKVHASQYHSVDNLLTQLTCIAIWFNPFIWLYNKDLKQNLEFIADQETQRKFNCKKSYQTILLKTSMPSHQMALSNHFYNSLIKKRIVMLHKSKSKKINLIKYAFVVPLLAIFLMSFNTEEIYVEKEAPIEAFKIEDAYSKYSFDPFYEDNENNLPNKEPKTEIVAPSNKIKPLNNSKIKNKLTKIESQEKTGITITKETSDNDLDKIKTSLKEKGITAKFKSIKRNRKGKIVAIKIAVSSKNANANYSIGSDTPIKPIVISINNNGNNINIGNSSDNSINALGYGNMKLHNNKENNVIVLESDSIKMRNNITPWKVTVGRRAGKVFNDSINLNNVTVIGYADSLPRTKGVLNAKNIFVISDDDKENIFEEDHAYITGKSNAGIKITSIDGKEPLFIIDGKEITKRELNSLNPDNIDSISVLKDKSATAVYGDKGKDGVVLITTKKKSPWKVSAVRNKNVVFATKEDTIYVKEKQYLLKQLIDSPEKQLLYILDGKEVKAKDIVKLDEGNIARISQMEGGDNAIEQFGEKAKNGVVELTSKTENPKTPSVKVVGAALYIVDGKELKGKNIEDLDPNKIESINVLKGGKAIKKYGNKGKDGVIEITTKKVFKSTIDLDESKSPINFIGIQEGKKPIYIINGKESSRTEALQIKSNNFKSITSLRGKEAIKKHGKKAKDGVIEITTKKK